MKGINNTSANSVFAQLRADTGKFSILSLIIFSYGLTSSKPPAILATLPGAGCVYAFKFKFFSTFSHRQRADES
jgi:hypothetical protein